MKTGLLMFLIIGRHIFSEGKNTANTEHGSLGSFRGGGKGKCWERWFGRTSTLLIFNI